LLRSFHDCESRLITDGYMTQGFSERTELKIAKKDSQPVFDLVEVVVLLKDGPRTAPHSWLGGVDLPSAQMRYDRFVVRFCTLQQLSK
jgi:hypothetical protein